MLPIINKQHRKDEWKRYLKAWDNKKQPLFGTAKSRSNRFHAQAQSLWHLRNCLIRLNEVCDQLPTPRWVPESVSSWRNTSSHCCLIRNILTFLQSEDASAICNLSAGNCPVLIKNLLWVFVLGLKTRLVIVLLMIKFVEKVLDLQTLKSVIRWSWSTAPT